MSQYPPPPYSPYTPPQPNLSFDYYRPAGFGGPAGMAAQNPLAPARRASVLMFILGALTLLSAGCMGVMAATNPFDKMPPEQTAGLRQAEAQAGMSIEVILVVWCVILLAGGAAFIGLGVWVRRGSSAAAITGAVVTGMAALTLAFIILVGVGQSGSNPESLMGACVFVLPLAACVLLLFWLVQAAKAAKAVAAAQMQFAMQYWQSQQQQQAYGQFGQPPNPYGPYGYPGAAYPPGQQQAAGGYGYGYGQQAAYPPSASGGQVPPAPQGDAGDPSRPMGDDYPPREK